MNSDNTGYIPYVMTRREVCLFWRQNQWLKNSKLSDFDWSEQKRKLWVTFNMSLLQLRWPVIVCSRFSNLVLYALYLISCEEDTSSKGTGCLWTRFSPQKICRIWDGDDLGNCRRLVLGEIIISKWQPHRFKPRGPTGRGRCGRNSQKSFLCLFFAVVSENNRQF